MSSCLVGVGFCVLPLRLSGWTISALYVFQILLIFIRIFLFSDANFRIGLQKYVIPMLIYSHGSHKWPYSTYFY